MTEVVLPDYKLIIAGGRDFNDMELLSMTVQHLADTELADKSVSIVSGMARGADALGYLFAHQRGVVVHEFPAQWDRYGKKAGFMRNTQMAKEADGLLAFFSGSNGTAHMIKCMADLNKPVWIVPYNGYINESPRPY